MPEAMLRGTSRRGIGQCAGKAKVGYLQITWSLRFDDENIAVEEDKS